MSKFKECDECGAVQEDTEYIDDYDMYLCNDCLDEYLGCSTFAWYEMDDYSY